MKTFRKNRHEAPSEKESEAGRTILKNRVSLCYNYFSLDFQRL
jgi:hypothetical protein